MALLEKSAAAATDATGVQSVTLPIIFTVILQLIKLLGPIAVPIIEAWVAKLPLTPAQIALIDSFIEGLLSKTPVTLPTP